MFQMILDRIPSLGPFIHKYSLLLLLEMQVRSQLCQQIQLTNET